MFLALVFEGHGSVSPERFSKSLKTKLANLAAKPDFDELEGALGETQSIVRKLFLNVFSGGDAAS